MGVVPIWTSRLLIMAVSVILFIVSVLASSSSCMGCWHRSSEKLQVKIKYGKIKNDSRDKLSMAHNNIMTFWRLRQANISHPRCRSTAIKGRHHPRTILQMAAMKLQHPNPHRRTANLNAINLVNLILGHFSYWDLIDFFWLKDIAMSLNFFWLSQLSTSVARFSVNDVKMHLDPTEKKKCKLKKDFCIKWFKGVRI